MAVIFLQHLPRLSLDALRALDSSFSFALTPTHMAVIFFATSSQAEPGRTTRSGLKFFFSLTPAHMAVIFFATSSQAEPGRTTRSGLEFFFCLSACADGGLFTVASQTGPKAAPARSQI